MFKLQFTFQPGLNVNQILAFELAGQIWSHFLQDDMTVDIHVTSTDQLPDSVLGGAIPNYQSSDLATVQLALQRDITSGEDIAAVEAIGMDGLLSGMVGSGKYTGSTVTLTQAQATALGIELSDHQSDLDGYIVLNSLRRSPLTWNYDFSREENPDINSLDILSVALHEVGHILGFVSGLDAPTQRTVAEQLAQTTILDLFRYSDRSRLSGVNELTRGVSAYFSIDGGNTNLAPLASGILPLGNYTQGHQASHWGTHQVKVNGIEVAADTGPIIQFINAMTQLASPVDSDNWIDSVEQLLAYANGGAVDQDIQVVLGEIGEDLGILDPTLTPTERSSISALDLIAFDVIGYDLKDGSTLDLNYGQLLKDAKETVSNNLGLEAKDLEIALQNKVSVWGHDRLGEVLSAINRSEVYEQRRQRRRVTRSASFWQEEDLESNALQIISNGGGTLAKVAVESGATWVTRVQASPRSPLNLITQTREGTDHNDLIITPNQKIVDQGGHNTIYLGRQGGEIKTGLGNDILYSNGGDTTVQDRGGHNTILLQGYSASTHKIETGSGDDIIELTANKAKVQAGEGNDTIFARNVSSSPKDAPQFLVTASGGDNTIKLEGNTHQSLVVVTGDGNDYLDLVGKKAVIHLGGGNNQLVLNATEDTEIRADNGHNVLRIHGALEGKHRVVLGDGNSQVQVIGTQVELTAGHGNHWIDLDTPTTSDKNKYDVQVEGGDTVLRLGGNRQSDHKAEIGAGNDVIEARSGKVTLTTGEGQDLIILGDHEQVYFSETGKSDYLHITDFSEHDHVLLHGDRQDYSVESDELFYKGELIAKFQGGIQFDLSRDRVLFDPETEQSVEPLPTVLIQGLAKIQSADMIAAVEAIAPPKREDILLNAQTQFLKTEAVTYRIVSGVDADLFQVDLSTGHLAFKDPVDVDLPQDANGDGIYEVRVRAVQGGGETEKVLDSQLLYIRPEALVDHSQALPRLEGDDLENSLIGTEDAEIIQGRSGKDVIQGNGGSDQLFGDAGNDAIFGGAGNDTLVGSNSVRRGTQEIDHYVAGGLGQDLFVLGDVTGSFYATAEGADFMQIADFEAGVDQVSLYGHQQDYQIETEEGSTWLYYLEDAIAVFDQRPDLTWDDLVGDRRIVFDPAELSINGSNTAASDSSETPPASAIGTAAQTLTFDNILNGTEKADTLDGGGGQDILRGRQGADYLVGGVGNDTLFGQDGADTLEGSSATNKKLPEKDVLFGGKGSDLFILGDQQSTYYTQYRLKDQALIKDFSVSQDRIQLKGSAADYQLKSVGAHLAVSHEGDRVALLNNVSSLSLSSSAFQYV